MSGIESVRCIYRRRSVRCEIEKRSGSECWLTEEVSLRSDTEAGMQKVG